jgi:hypothetical protein
MARLTDRQRREFKELGFLVLRDAVDPDDVAAAREAVWDAIPYDADDYEGLVEAPTRFENVMGDIEDREPFAAINDRLFEYAEALVGEGVLEPPGDGMQIAPRFPEGDAPHHPWAKQPRDLNSHIDGYGADYSLGDEIGHSALFGVVYFDRVRPTGGGFTVWPGSHWNVGEYFRTHALEAGKGGVAGMDDGAWDYDAARSDQFDPVELWGDAGTVVLAHYKIEHCGGVNLSPDARLAGIKRFSQEDGDAMKREAAADIWRGWPAMADVEVGPHAYPREVADEDEDASTVEVIERRE